MHPRFPPNGGGLGSALAFTGTSTNGVAATIGDITLDAGESVQLDCTLVANRSDAAGVERFYSNILAHRTAAGVTTIDDESPVLPTEGTGWTVAYTVVGTAIRCTFTGAAGQTVPATLYVRRLSKTGGF